MLYQCKAQNRHSCVGRHSRLIDDGRWNLLESMYVYKIM
jgi:hypothetical protein